jgi:signal transduction histidine kinase
MEQTPAERRQVRVVLGRAPDAGVTVAVRDSGCGIPAEIAADLFKPFFSTKAQGMGLGLSICRSIVEYHQGELTGASDPGGGSTFRFTLPLEASP